MTPKTRKAHAELPHGALIVTPIEAGVNPCLSCEYLYMRDTETDEHCYMFQEEPSCQCAQLREVLP